MNRRGFFDDIAGRWDTMERPDIDLRLVRVARATGLQPGNRVLDVGTGTGVLIPHLLELVGGQGRVVALDISAGMLEVARSKGFPGNVDFLQADFQTAALPQAGFDVVVCNAVFPHFTDKEVALAQAMRLLKPGCRLVISHPIGREAVNNLHREASAAVAEDRVPAAAVMEAMLRRAGFGEAYVIDEPEFYLAAAVKPSLQ